MEDPSARAEDGSDDEESPNEELSAWIRANPRDFFATAGAANIQARATR